MRDFDDSTLWRISAYERMRAESGTSGFARLTTATTLPTTLAAELNQLQRARSQTEVLEVVAACIRQSENALVLLRHRDLVWPLTLFPRRHLYHLPRPIIQSLELGNADLQVIDVEPAGLRPPGHTMTERIGHDKAYRPLPPLLWALAVHAPRAVLLHDISGHAAYRLNAGFEPDAPTLSGAMGPALRRLRHEIAPLQSIAQWQGMDLARATRLLNAVYLQGGLMVLRNHAAARNSQPALQRLRGWLRPPR